VKLVEVAAPEPFVVIMLRKLLTKGEKVHLVIVQDDGTWSRMGVVLGVEHEADRTRYPDVYLLDVFTNISQKFAYEGKRLRRADLRLVPHRFEPPAWTLLVPSSNNGADLGGHDA
jgi:hypothetical protein